MAIRCKDLPFRLSFITGKEQSLEEVSCFYKSAEELYDVLPSVELKENLQLRVFFESDDTMAKLYIEGMDELIHKDIEEEEGQLFISPMTVPMILFESGDYPLSPGYYQIIVETKAEKYYASVSVKTLHISQPAWEMMRDDLESLLPGLAMDLVFRNLGFNKSYGAKVPLPPYSLFAFLVINQNFAEIMSALTDLMTKINFRLSKEYQEKPMSSGAIVDERSLKYKLTRPGKSETIMSPVKSLDYDLQENRWIKQIVYFTTRILEDFLEAVLKYSESLKKEIVSLEQYGDGSRRQREIKEKTIVDMGLFYEKAKKMQVALRMIENAPWYASVLPLRTGNVPAVLFMDSRYRILYKVYQEIKRRETTVILDKMYAYQWKCTNKLYEAWCFVQICKTLNDLEFNLCGGWLSDIKAESAPILVPAILPGTSAEFGKDNVRIRVAYDSKIPYMIDETDHDTNPLYIGGSHNNPDIKLDVYVDDIYSGSLLVEVKYRNPGKVWENEKLKTSLRTKVMNQLICYSLESVSPHLYGDNCLDIRPVPEVWVLYPKKGSIYDRKFFPDHRIRFICLSPESSNTLGDLLEKRIFEFQNRSNVHRKKNDINDYSAMKTNK